MGLLTKVAKGVAFGDASNQSVRNILTELSKSLYGGITEQEMEDTLDYFDGKCPYTGKNLKKSIEDEDGSYATDHIYPQNKDWCGLNVKGNLVIVDKKANNAKGEKDIKTFMKEDSDFWRKLGVDEKTRLSRLKKIEDFQKSCGYDPERIRSVVNPLMTARYNEVRAEQEKTICNTLDALEKVGIVAIKKTTSPSAVTSTDETKKRKALVELIFHPSNETLFKEQLLVGKKAHFVLTYDSGKEVISPWKVTNFNIGSNLRGNIQSRPFWKNKNKEGLVKVDVFVD